MNLGNCILFSEALLCQLPIVGLDRNAFPAACQVNGRFGFACKEEDPQLLAELLEEGA